MDKIPRQREEDEVAFLLVLGVPACGDRGGGIAVGGSGCVGDLDLALGESIMHAVGCLLLVTVAFGLSLLLGVVLCLLFILSSGRVICVGGFGLALL